MNPLLAKTLLRLRRLSNWLVAKLVLFVLRVLRLFPAKPALNFVGAAARKIGPFLGRHRVAMHNLQHAFPEKSEAECREIALEMWDNMGRLAAEYIFLDKLATFVGEGEESSTVEFVGIDIFDRARDDGKPHIFFTAHMGNFELLPIAARRYGMPITSLFRPPNNPYIAEELAKTRNLSMDDLLPSRVGASFTLARILDKGGNIGALVDQKFHGGIRTKFFGRECNTSPLLARLARQFDCDIHPCRCLRLPGNRYRIEIMERITPPRTDDGRIDVPGTAQMFNDIVEGWIREDPGQWMWFHRRWAVFDY